MFIEALVFSFDFTIEDIHKIRKQKLDLYAGIPIVSAFKYFCSCFAPLNLPFQPYKNVRFQQRNVSENDGCTFLFLL